MTDREIVCYECNGTGHMARNCPKGNPLPTQASRAPASIARNPAISRASAPSSARRAATAGKAATATAEKEATAIAGRAASAAGTGSASTATNRGTWPATAQVLGV